MSIMDRNVLESPRLQDEFRPPAGEVRLDGGEVYHPYIVPALIDHNTIPARLPEGFSLSPGDLGRLSLGEVDAIEVPTQSPRPTGREFAPYDDEALFWPGVGKIPSMAPRKQEVVLGGRMARIKAAAKAAGRFMLGGY
jgi:hypothetical protein